jgi:hypothetical protein
VGIDSLIDASSLPKYKIIFKIIFPQQECENVSEITYASR